MSEHERTTTIPAESEEDDGAEVVPFPPARTRRRRRLRLWRRRKRPKRFRIRKLRVLLLLIGLGLLASVSAALRHVHGGRLRPAAARGAARHKPSMLYDRNDVAIGTLTGNERRIYLNETQIAPVMKHAIIAIEDRRFYTNSGVDLRGIARAAIQDVHQQTCRPGRLDDPAAVREDLARRRERPHGLPEAARGGARLPAHAPLVQGPDPAQLPQRDLLRQRRLRDRVRRAARTSATTTTTAASAGSRPAPRCCSRRRPRCWPGWSPRRAPMTRSRTRWPRASGATSCCCGCSSRAI